MKRFLTNLFGITLLNLLAITCFAAPVYGAEHARPSISGRLSVDGTNIVDANGRIVVLKGVSTHSLVWYSGFLSDDLFDTISTEWNCNLVRLAVYSDEYAKGMRDKSLEAVRRGIDAAIDSDMYVIVDWHVLTEQDPNVYEKEAEDFFSTICNEYPDCPNIIYEICNEPNGETTWTDIKTYAYMIIPMIRSVSPDSLIIVGTPDYDKGLFYATRSPLNYNNIMYALHFYAATHGEDLREMLIAAHEDALPVFVSECGISEASGDGKLDYTSATEWFNLLQDYDISFAVWSFSDKHESSAMIREGFDFKKPLEADDLTPCGSWIRSLIQGADPASIPVIEGNNETGIIVSAIKRSLAPQDINPARRWPVFALGIIAFLALSLLIGSIYRMLTRGRYETYDSLSGNDKRDMYALIRTVTLLVSIFFTMLYLLWRIAYSIPKDSGILAVTGNILLLIVEVVGFIESLILYMNLMKMRKHPLPQINDDEYPDVDIFIATYNEPAELLRKTINGCKHIKYPDRSKVHIWVCDDNRRQIMRDLADQMGVGYFDRPDNKGAKAGNLNSAMARTSSPYIVTLDADMIPMSGFLMNTIPYFVDAAKKGIKLALLQTPQCFYQPDVFQHTLYSEKNAPNEQDFFYRTIEVSRTGTNSVIYGGSNTILSREALNAIGGFYTKTITEDFATGMLMESNGFVSLALSEPMASGMAPDTYKEHIQQRTRWGRGVIGTSKQLRLLRQKGLSVQQKLSYLSSVLYWFSPIKNLIYIVSPLLFATFAIPVFKCSWLDLIMYWLPMFIMQDVTLRVFSNNAVSLKWSGIYETSVMPHLLIPIIKETFGMTASKFEVTDKTGKYKRNHADLHVLMPFYILIALSVIGIIRSLCILDVTYALGIFVLLFWLVRNLYFLIMSLFIVNGRDSDIEPVKVIDAEPISVQGHEGITTYMTEHSLKAFLDDSGDISVGDKVLVSIEKDTYKADVSGIVTGITIPRSGGTSSVVTVEITDMKESWDEYLQILYDRIPTLPQSLHRDLGIVRHLLVNIAHRILDKR